MELVKCVKGENRKIVGFKDGVDENRMIALGFFVGAEIIVLKKKKAMMLVCVSNTVYAIDNIIASGVIVK